MNTFKPDLAERVILGIFVLVCIFLLAGLLGCGGGGGDPEDENEHIPTPSVTCGNECKK